MKYLLFIGLMGMTPGVEEPVYMCRPDGYCLVQQEFLRALIHKDVAHCTGREI